jgi:NTP pyrophosphatase (non-canonical NTP hydrolase)
MSKESTDSIRYLQEQIIAFRDERDWAQFHTPKNTAANIAVEAGELLDAYRWKEEASDSQAVSEEAADVLYALLLFCQAEQIDIGDELIKKLAKNAHKYPVDKAKGNNGKYHEL